MRNRILLFIPLALVIAGCSTCNKKVQNLETRVEALENSSVPRQTTQDTATSEAQVTASSTANVAAQEATVTDTPTKKDIQTALKNAGYYDGAIDGKIGRKTKKAIEKFQAANELKVDGKTGPNTWSKLKKYLTSSEPSNPLVK